MRSSTSAVSVAEIQRIADQRQIVVPLGTGRQCSVTFRAQINNAWHNGYGTYDWYGEQSEAEACTIALEVGKQILINNQPRRQVASQQQMVCSDEPVIQERAVQEGDLIKESQVMPHPNKPLPFTYKNSSCKWFIETDTKGNDMYQWQGVICLVRPDTWKVMSKF